MSKCRPRTPSVHTFRLELDMCFTTIGVMYEGWSFPHSFPPLTWPASYQSLVRTSALGRRHPCNSPLCKRPPVKPYTRNSPGATHRRVHEMNRFPVLNAGVGAEDIPRWWWWLVGGRPGGWVVWYRRWGSVCPPKDRSAPEHSLPSPSIGCSAAAVLCRQQPCAGGGGWCRKAWGISVSAEGRDAWCGSGGDVHAAAIQPVSAAQVQRWRARRRQHPWHPRQIPQREQQRRLLLRRAVAPAMTRKAAAAAGYRAAPPRPGRQPSAGSGCWA